MLKKINNERGVALITALLVLAILTMLGLAAVLTSTTDMQISTNEKIAVQGQYAAEAGIEDVMAFINRTTNIEPAGTTWSTTPPPNPQWVKSRIRTISAGGAQFFTYSATLSYKKVSGTGTSYDDSVAFYNRTAGFSKAPSGSGGWPVYQIKSIATRGNFQSQEVVLELTRNDYVFGVKGGVTAGGDLTIGGSFNIDSRFHNADGTLMGTGNSDPTCTNASLASPKPSVFANGSTIIPANKLDNYVFPGGVDRTDRGSDVPSTPWGAMGMDYDASTSLFDGNNFVDIFPDAPLTPGPTGATFGNKYYDANTQFDDDGNGLLIVHNPLFVADKTSAMYCATGDFDTGAPIGNPCNTLYRPRELSKAGGNSTYKGVIIADKVDFTGGGDVVITGALISLTPFDTSGWNGNATIKYSCAAIQRFAAGQINKKLNWHRE